MNEMIKYVEGRWLNKKHKIIAIKHKGKWIYYNQMVQNFLNCKYSQIPWEKRPSCCRTITMRRVKVGCETCEFWEPKS